MKSFCNRCLCSELIVLFSIVECRNSSAYPKHCGLCCACYCPGATADGVRLQSLLVLGYAFYTERAVWLPWLIILEVKVILKLRVAQYASQTLWMPCLLQCLGDCSRDGISATGTSGSKIVLVAILTVSFATMLTEGYTDLTACNCCFRQLCAASVAPGSFLVLFRRGYGLAASFLLFIFLVPPTVCFILWIRQRLKCRTFLHLCFGLFLLRFCCFLFCFD
mmetsp:Transcript_44423/g.69454  ORF Transcript_44423/g.69454 Transcript_44423/m.69454 type:complete len:221 (-) Transcript_44423:1202-1864(-)